MIIDVVQNYVNTVSGLTETTRKKAQKLARSLLAQAGLEEAADNAADRVTKLTDDIMATSAANRKLVENLVQAEVDKAIGRVGLVRADEFAKVQRELADLRLTLADSPARRSAMRTATAGRAATARKVAGTSKSAARKPSASTGAAKKSTAKKSTAKKSSAKKSSAKAAE